nr:unnamed protein product [Digitaria exilis]
MQPEKATPRHCGEDTRPVSPIPHTKSDQIRRNEEGSSPFRDRGKELGSRAPAADETLAVAAAAARAPREARGGRVGGSPGAVAWTGRFSDGGLGREEEGLDEGGGSGCGAAGPGAEAAGRTDSAALQSMFLRYCVLTLWALMTAVSCGGVVSLVRLATRCTLEKPYVQLPFMGFLLVIAQVALTILILANLPAAAGRRHQQPDRMILRANRPRQG